MNFTIYPLNLFFPSEVYIEDGAFHLTAPKNPHGISFLKVIQGKIYFGKILKTEHFLNSGILNNPHGKKVKKKIIFTIVDAGTSNI